MRRLAGAVIALHHHAAIVCKARENRHGRVGIEDIARVQIGHPLVLFGKGGHHHVGVEAEQLARRDLEEIGRATSELQSLMRLSYAVFCLKKKNHNTKYNNTTE